MAVRVPLTCVLLVLSTYSLTQAPSVAFHGVEEWKDSLTVTAITSLRGLYSTDPPAKFMAKGQKPAPDISPETDFWQRLVSSGMTDFDVTQLESQDKKGLHLVTLAVSMKIKTPDGPRNRYVTEQQAWQQQGDRWRIVADAKKDHQRVILVFGANWCYDCHVLDQAFHQTDVAQILQRNFQVVHVDIGDDGKKNGNVAVEYQIPLEKGIPALAVLDSDGKLLYSQENGEWESARSLDPDDLVALLNRWKP